MGQSTNGQICYGVKIDEEATLPWKDSPYDGDIDSWWRQVNGYKPPFELYDANGNYISGKKPSKELTDEYFAAEHRWDETHPIIPVTEINYCSADYPMYILAIPSTVIAARRGYPETFNPSQLVIGDVEIAALLAFCDQYRIEHEGYPSWWLSSYWG